MNDCCKDKHYPKGDQPYIWCVTCGRDLAENVPKRRTLIQNAALHQWFHELAAELNNRGLDVRAVLKPTVEIPWDARLVKEFIWKPIQEVKLGTNSTTKLSTKDVNVVYEVLDRHLLKKFDIDMQFPTVEDLQENK